MITQLDQAWLSSQPQILNIAHFIHAHPEIGYQEFQAVTYLAQLLAGKVVNAKELTKASYVVMQDVNRQLFSESVLKEVTIGQKSANTDNAKQLLVEMDLLDHQDRHPLSLSGGQKQRLVIASALACEKLIYIFYEPTSGVDYRHLAAISNRLRSLAKSGAVVIVERKGYLCLTHPDSYQW